MTAPSPVASYDSGLALLALKIGPNQFDLNRGLTYVSMRDQVLRARTLVHAACKARIFDMNPEAAHYADKPVDVDITVIGAGVGGLSVALAAVEKGLKVLVLDKGSRPFSLLRAGTDRLISATIYDWPAYHFDIHAFPHVPQFESKDPLPDGILKFPSSPVKATELADHFESQVDDHVVKFDGKLFIEQNININVMEEIHTSSGRRVLLTLPKEIKLPAGTNGNKVQSRIVVFAIGFGSEKTFSTHGVAQANFWSYNDIEADVSDAVSGSLDVHVLGGGDGGLQEALRFALSPENHDLSKVARSLETSLTAASHNPERVLREIMAAEDNAARAFMWGYSIEAVFGALDQAHERAIEELLSDGAVVSALIAWRKSVVRSHELSIILHDGHAFSGRVYALNRFLFKLLCRKEIMRGGDLSLVRTTKAYSEEEGGKVVSRTGISQTDEQYGTSEKEDFLRRSAFRSLPNHYGAFA